MTRGHARPAPAVLVGLSLALALGLIVGGCGFAAATVVTPPPSPVAPPSLDSAIGAARARLASALAPVGFQLRDPQVAYRPAESPSLTDARRTVVQAVIPAAPDRGFIVLYELADPAAADAAAHEQAAYIASGIGRVQFPNDARFVLRVVGPVVVFYTWSPSSRAAPNDEKALGDAIATIGQGVSVPG
ncbi:MAG TPA: hypothetical protein VEY67_12705 [Candidatus Dormibacteraeota bacterium]|nr:hypothetical protein [Candidatus Dormibacteraeota bacterium]